MTSISGLYSPSIWTAASTAAQTAEQALSAEATEKTVPSVSESSRLSLSSDALAMLNQYDTNMELSAESSGSNMPDTVEIDVTAVAFGGNSKADLYINGQKVVSDYDVSARMSRHEKETIRVSGDFGPIDTVELAFTNDNGLRRIHVLGARINGEEQNLQTGITTSASGEVFTGQTKIFWNGSYKLQLGTPAAAPVEESPAVPLPEDTVVAAPGETIPTPPPAPSPPVVDQWGGLDGDIYRGNYVGRDRAPDAAVSGTKITIEAGTSVKAILAKLKAVPENTPVTLHFAEGEHRFTESLLIRRGNITIEGEGEGKTVFVADFPLGKDANLIQIQGDDINYSAGSNNGRWQPDPTKLVGKASADFSFGDTKLKLTNSAGLKVGDHIMVFKKGTSSVSDDSDEFGTIAEITGIEGNMLTLKHGLAFGSDQLGGAESLKDVKVYKMNLLENVTVRDFSIRYDIPETALNNPLGELTDDILNTMQNFYTRYAAGSGESTGNAHYGHTRALVISGTHEANVSHIGMNDVGSGGFFSSGNLEMNVDDLLVDGTHNKGAGGNGYGVEYDKTYYSDFTNLALYGLRHGVTANMMGGSGYNNFHVRDTDSNLDFHGGRDQGNIYYVENMTIKPYYLPVMDNKGKLTLEINHDYGKVQFGLISYRRGEVNEQENTVIFGNVQGNDGISGDGKTFYNALGEKLAATHGNNDDRLVARDSGAVIRGGFGNDKIVSGHGDDILDGGGGIASAQFNSDQYMFRSDNGSDIVENFDQFDTIAVEENINNSGIHKVEDLLKVAYQSGLDVRINLGGDNSITLRNTELASLSGSQFRMINVTA